MSVVPIIAEIRSIAPTRCFRENVLGIGIGGVTGKPEGGVGGGKINGFGDGERKGRGKKRKEENLGKI